MSERFQCTKENPWTREKAPFADHPDAIDIGTCYEGCCDKYKCPHCGLTFQVELPQ